MMELATAIGGVSGTQARASVPAPTIADRRSLWPAAAKSRSGTWERTGEHEVSRVRPRQVPAPNGGSFDKIASRSAPMNAALDTLRRLASTDVTVTLIGETGTGKDVLAHALHDESPRARAPFVVFDCGAVAPNLAESELFGHERGSFTGAVSAYAGAFERANGGTLFLDEIGDLPLELQPRLLRALENRRVRRVGGTEDRPLDVRILAATHRDLRAEVTSGRFRQDLFFRLAAAVVVVPPLRDRLEDLPVLLVSLLDGMGSGHVRVSEAAVDALRAHLWLGNVRELKNVLACAVALLDAGTTVLEPEHFQFVSNGAEGDSALDALPLGGQRLEMLERSAIRQTIAGCDGNKVRAARALGIAVSTLYEKLKKYRLADG